MKETKLSMIKDKEFEFSVGDAVWIKNHYRKKLDPLLEGPYQVVEKLSDNSYIINKPSRGRASDIFHISHLRPVL